MEMGLGATIGKGFGAATFKVCVDVMGNAAAGVTLMGFVDETTSDPPIATGNGLVSDTRFGCPPWS